MGIAKGILRLLPVLLVLAMMASSATAQNYAERTVDGNDYYLYYVEPGNTLYAISKMFSVSVEDLVNANPTAGEGLEIGQEILVPIRAVNKREARKKEVSVEGDVILHTVQKKETFFSISKDYGVSVNELMEMNPEHAQTLSTGVTLKVPSAKSSKVQGKFLEPAMNDSFIVHQVQSGETLYSLAKQYGMSQDSLLSMNPDLALGVKKDQYLIVPVYNEEFLKKLSERKAEELKEEWNIPLGKEEVYDFALMLPFEMEFNDSLDKALSQGEDLYILTEIALEYYRGTLMALDSLAKLGLSANLHVYEVGEDIVDTRETLKKSELRDMDLIFGPLHKASLAMVSEMTVDEKIYLVSPNSFTNEVFEDNPYLLRASTSKETMLRYLANYIAINHQYHNVLMLNSESPKGWPMRKEFIKSYNLAASTFRNAYSDSLRSVTKGMFNREGEVGEIVKFLREDTLNVIVVPSNDLAFVSDVMTRLSLLENEYQVQVYGLDDWIKYENIEAEYKNRLKLRLVVPSYVDYDNPTTIEFLKAYRKEYGTDPSHYDYGFKGYDLTLFFGKALLREGLAFPMAFDKLKLEGTAGSYRFGKSTTGREFENKETYILEYDNYKIKRVN
ncbi:MAG TPA: LysM peptidoglycan-binding domain-containing protein [Cryomorphaceae bacterium]|nr:LysM peptidoglycan-binding domain-containing protein [Cryomorphaceae bacterium]